MHTPSAIFARGRRAANATDYRRSRRRLRLPPARPRSPQTDVRHNVVVGEAADGEEALAVVLRERPDIVVTDLIMPRLNGVELIRRIRQELPEAKVVLMSSHTEDAYRLMASNSGADAFVNKHVITSNLVPALLDLIRRRFSGGSGPPTIGGSSASASRDEL
jgi:DNA-binding NarL/FixJ family response regulator